MTVHVVLTHVDAFYAFSVGDLTGSERILLLKEMLLWPFKFRCPIVSRITSQGIFVAFFLILSNFLITLAPITLLIAG